MIREWSNHFLKSNWWKKQLEFRQIQFLFLKDIDNTFQEYLCLLSSHVYLWNSFFITVLQIIFKCWQWRLKGNELVRLNKLPWNEPEIFRILYQIGTKVRNWCFYLVMVYLSLLEGFLYSIIIQHHYTSSVLNI